MDTINYVDMSKSRYTTQFDNDKAFDAIVQTLVEYKMRVQQRLIDFADIILDIDKSTGANLDLIGSIVGQSRILVDYYSKNYFGFEGNPKAEPYDQGVWYSLFSDSGGDSRVLTDEEYRRAIKARIISNNTNCSRKDYIDILTLLMGNTNFRISVPSHGNIEITLAEGTELDYVQYFLSRVENLDSLIPKPLGFRIIVKVGVI